MEDLRAAVLRANLSGGSKHSAVESAGLCPSCRGSGLRPTTGLWAEWSAHGISAGMLLTSPKGWSRSTKRLVWAFVGSVCATAGWSTLTAVLHAVQ